LFLTKKKKKGRKRERERERQGCSQVEMLEQARKLTEKFRCPMTKKKDDIYENVLLQIILCKYFDKN